MEDPNNITSLANVEFYKKQMEFYMQKADKLEKEVN